MQFDRNNTEPIEFCTVAAFFSNLATYLAIISTVWNAH